MPLKNGVQYASRATKRCPMFDPACAAKVAEHIARFYPQATGACDCNAAERATTSHRAQIEARVNTIENVPGMSDADLVAYLTAPYAVEPLHTAECASRTPIPVDGLAIIEKACGRFVRGAHKGQLRGWATIEVVTEGGWLRHGPGERNGNVVYPGTILGINIGDDFTGKTYLSIGR
jgi:hypothetical protein